MESAKKEGLTTLRECFSYFGISKQCYYQSLKRRSFKQKDMEVVLDSICDIRKLHPTIGVHKIQHLLSKDYDIHIGRDSLYSLMHQHNLMYKRRKKIPFNKGKKVCNDYGNLAQGASVVRCNQLWVADITYLKLNGRNVYLALILDSYSRRIMGYCYNKQMDVSIVIDALKHALAQIEDDCYTLVDLVCHSDRGSQYTSKEHRDFLESRNIKVSYTNYSVYENAQAERLNGILKYEYGLKRNFRKELVLKQAISEGVYLYNHYRPHEALSYKTPNEFYEEAVVREAIVAESF